MVKLVFSVSLNPDRLFNPFNVRGRGVYNCGNTYIFKKKTKRIIGIEKSFV